MRPAPRRSMRAPRRRSPTASSRGRRSRIPRSARSRSAASSRTRSRTRPRRRSTRSASRTPRSRSTSTTLFPKIAIADVAATALGGGLYRITAEVENAGYLPTSTAHGVLSRSVKPTMVQLGVAARDHRLRRREDELHSRAGRIGPAPELPVDRARQTRPGRRGQGRRAERRRRRAHGDPEMKPVHEASRMPAHDTEVGHWL